MRAECCMRTIVQLVDWNSNKAKCGAHSRHSTLQRGARVRNWRMFISVYELRRSQCDWCPLPLKLTIAKRLWAREREWSGNIMRKTNIRVHFETLRPGKHMRSHFPLRACAPVCECVYAITNAPIITCVCHWDFKLIFSDARQHNEFHIYYYVCSFDAAQCDNHIWIGKAKYTNKRKITDRI